MNKPMIKLIAPEKTSGFYDELVINLQYQLGKDGRVFIALGEGQRDAAIALPTVNEIIIALGSAGVFSALYQIVSAYLKRSDEREVTFEREGIKITIKGHSLPEEKELFRRLFADQESKARKKRSILKASRGKTKRSKD